jgi:hypothetical protein
LLKEIPIIGSIYKLSKAALSIRDRLFTKKLLIFISQLKDIPSQERQEIINKTETDPKIFCLAQTLCQETHCFHG